MLMQTNALDRGKAPLKMTPSSMVLDSQCQQLLNCVITPVVCIDQKLQQVGEVRFQLGLPLTLLTGKGPS